MTIRAVIFDWGGTLTPWHTVDHEALWRGVCGQHFPERADALAAAIWAAELGLWQATGDTRASATLDQVFDRAGLVPTEAVCNGENVLACEARVLVPLAHPSNVGEGACP